MSGLNEKIDDVISRCAAVRTLSTARAVTRHFDEALRPAGLTIMQFTLLVTINKTSPQSISEIGKRLSMDRTSVSRNLLVLEKAGLVERGPETAARKRPVTLTRDGKAKLRKAYDYWQTAQNTIEQSFDETGFKEAMASLRSLRDVC